MNAYLDGLHSQLTVDFIAGTVTVERYESFDYDEPVVESTRAMTDGERREIQDLLREARLLTWEEEYQDLTVMDGGGWLATMTWGVDGSFTSRGENDYPAEESWNAISRINELTGLYEPRP